MRILVTGGAGYIGSHTCVELLNEGYEVVIVDNLYNANKKAVDRVEEITGKKVTFYEADICDKEAMDAIFDKEDVQAVIHFAGLKAVGESTVKPLEYYQNNIAGTLTLCDVMRNHGVKNIIFSSSATVYGDPAMIPITGWIVGSIVGIFGGAVIIETLFSWKGVGKLLIDSLNQHDYTVALSMQMFYILLGLAANLITDLCYCIVDPRIKLD